MRTALEIGRELQGLGLRGPAPRLSIRDIRSLGTKVRIYKVGKRKIENCFLLVRSGYATLYVTGKYDGYRNAYKSIFKVSLTGRDIDHLFPRSRVTPDEYIAIGHIDSKINRKHGDNFQLGDIASKAMNYEKTHAKLLTDTPRAAELGLFVINGTAVP